MNCLLTISLALIFIPHDSYSYMLLKCDSSCHNQQLQQKVGYVEKCCYKDFAGVPTGQPVKPAMDLKVQIYVPKISTGSCRMIAFNITWRDSALIALSNESKGYLLQITRENSVVPKRIVLKLAKSLLINSPTNDSELHINYKRYGLTLNTEVEPGYLYRIYVYTLPFASLDSSLSPHSYIYEKIEVPKCKDDVKIQGTCNCPLEEPPTTAAKPAVVIPDSYATGPPSRSVKVVTTQPPSPVILVLVSVLGFVIIVALCVFIYVLFQRKKRHSNISEKTLFVAISVHDVNTSSPQSRFADRMCCFFQRRVKNLTYTLWHATELTQTNTAQWVSDHVESADHVLLVVTPAALKTRKNTQSPESQSFLNPAYDPYTIVQKKIEANLNSSDKFSIVYFDDDITIPSTLFHIKARFFKLPADALSLCRHLGGSDMGMGKALQRNIIVNYEVKIPIQTVFDSPDSDESDVPLIHYPKSNGKIAESDQIDSAYFSNQSSSSTTSNH